MACNEHQRNLMGTREKLYRGEHMVHAMALREQLYGRPTQYTRMVNNWARSIKEFQCVLMKFNDFQ